MQLFKRKTNQKVKNPSHSKVGRDPSIDWFILLCVFACMTVIVISLTAFRFYKANNFMTALSLNTGTSADAGVKTREEELQEIIEYYKTKQERHNQLLGNSKIEVKKDQELADEEARKAALASSTAAAQAQSKIQSEGQVQGASTKKVDTSVPSPAQSTVPKPAPKPAVPQEELQLVLPE